MVETFQVWQKIQRKTLKKPNKLGTQRNLNQDYHCQTSEN